MCRRGGVTSRFSTTCVSKYSGPSSRVGRAPFGPKRLLSCGAGRACAMARPPAVVRLECRLPPAKNTRIRLSNTSVEIPPPLGVSCGHPRGLPHATTSRHCHRGGSHGRSFAPPPECGRVRPRHRPARSPPHGSPALARARRAQDCRPKPYAQGAGVAKDRRAHRVRTPMASPRSPWTPRRNSTERSVAACTSSRHRGRMRSAPGVRRLSPPSNPDFLDILDGHLVGCPVVELGRARAFMRGDRLGALKRAAIE